MPGALTWDPTPPGGSQSTSRGGVNPAADGASLSSTEVAATRALVSGAGKGVTGVGLKTVLFGHSYIDQESGRNSGGADSFDNHKVTGTVQWANWLLGKPLQIVKEYGHGSWRLVDMFALYPDNVAPLNPQVLFVSLGHNDLKGLYAGDAGQEPDDDAGRQLPQMVAKMRAWLTDDVSPATTVFLLAETPPGKNPAGATVAANSKQLAVRFQQWNLAMRKFAIEFNNVVYVPLDRVTVDPTSTSMVNKDGHYWDQTHPSIVGAHARGAFLAPYIQRVLPIHCDDLPTSAADSWTETKLSTTGNPVFDGTSAVLTFSDNEYTSTGTLYHYIEIGDLVSVRIAGSANRALCGRYEVIAADATTATISCPGVTGTATAVAAVSASRQMLINPLMLTTTGGQQSPTGVVGAITAASGTPLGVTIDNLPATYAITLTTEAHTQRDGSDGFGNWLKLVITVSGSSGATACRITFPASSNLSSPATYDVERKIVKPCTLAFGAEIRQESASGGYAGVSAECNINRYTISTDATLDTYRAYDLYRVTADTPLTSEHPWPAADMTLTAMTPEVTLPATADTMAGKVNGYIHVYFIADGSVTLKIARAGLYVIDEPLEQTLISFN